MRRFARRAPHRDGVIVLGPSVVPMALRCAAGIATVPAQDVAVISPCKLLLHAWLEQIGLPNPPVCRSMSTPIPSCDRSRRKTAVIQDLANLCAGKNRMVATRAFPRDGRRCRASGC